ncbi:MAG: UDP-2,3-diacylglucosamine diphosphatase LpxI [Pseudomonadota bacterium]
MSDWRKLGLIAGAGDLPRYVAEACRAEDRLGHVIAIKGFGEPHDYPGCTVRGVGEIGGVFEDMKTAGCDAACFAGVVTRPDFKNLRPDWRGVSLLPKVLAAAARGDDALLRVIVGAFEAEGFQVVGSDEVAGSLLAREGVLGGVGLSADNLADARKAMETAADIGRLDIGQGVVVCDGLVLAVEAQEGTDRMIARVGELDAALRGNSGAPRGVLAKRPKPIQERRVDLPTIGVSTVERAAEAGLAGIVAPAGGALILGQKAVRDAADAAGLFVLITSEDGVV